jgi:hypothetical protein
LTTSATLLAIRNKVRLLVGNPTDQNQQLSDSSINTYINDTYNYDFPDHLKTFNLKTSYTFYTQANVDAYTFPTTTFESLTGNPRIGGYPGNLIENRSQFWGIFGFQANNESNLIVGNNTAGPYGFTTTAQPFIRGHTYPANNLLESQMFVATVDGSGNPLIAQDNGAGVFVDQNGGALAGTVNYVTGVVSGLTFGGVVPLGTTISVQYFPYNASLPTSALVYGGLIILRPIPDQIYQVEFDAFMTPAQLLNDSDTPVLQPWWELLAYGAARKILSDRLDMDGLQRIEPFWQERLSLAIRRTIHQMRDDRTPSIYTQQVGSPFFGSFAPWSTGL